MTKRYGYDPVTGNHSTPLMEGVTTAPTYDKAVTYQRILDGCSGQNILEDAYASFYGSATYTFRNKYVFSGTVRSDGSNNFGSDEQFNLNWTVSAAWNIDQEPWMAGISGVLSTLSLRSGFGYTGGVNKTVYPVFIMDYNTSFRNTEDDVYRMGYIRNAPNPHLSWEKNQTFNVGLNYGFLNDRIFGEVSYYHNKNLDLVTQVAVPQSTGFDSQSYNTSEQVNHGVELTLGATILRIKDFSWRITANAAYNYNVLTKYVSPNGDIFGEYYVGYPIGHIFAGKTSGIDPATGIYKYVLRPDITITDAADYRQYENYLFYVGTSNAPWTGGFSTTFSYKRLSLNIAGNFSAGAKILNDITSPVDYTTAGEGGENQDIPSQKNDLYVNHLNVVRDVTYRWTVENPVTDGYPRLMDAYGARIQDPYGNYIDNLQPLSSSRITNCDRLEDVSYLKISSISLTYSLPQRWADAVRLNDINVSFLMNNLFIFTNYSGMDPETPGAVYPQSRSFAFNLSFSF